MGSGWITPNLVHIGLTVSKLFHFFIIKFQFFVGGHLGFRKIAFLAFPVSGRCQDEAPCQIWWKSDWRFWSYSIFSKFQNGGRRPSWIMNFTILRPRASPGRSRWYIPNLVHIGRNVSTLFNFFFYSKFQFFVGGHLWFWKNGGCDTSGVLGVSRRSSIPNLVRIGRTVQELFKFV